MEQMCTRDIKNQGVQEFSLKPLRLYEEMYGVLQKCGILVKAVHGAACFREQVTHVFKVAEVTPPTLVFRTFTLLTTKTLITRSPRSRTFTEECLSTFDGDTKVPGRLYPADGQCAVVNRSR
jgi:hypothetical protein